MHVETHAGLHVRQSSKQCDLDENESDWTVSFMKFPNSKFNQNWFIFSQVEFTDKWIDEQSDSNRHSAGMWMHLTKLT
jgi:hypothetical protein